MFEFVAIVWFLCAITCAVIASGKNRNGVGWFFIGLLIGIFGLIMIICLPALKPGDKRAPNEGAYG